MSSRLGVYSACFNRLSPYGSGRVTEGNEALPAGYVGCHLSVVGTFKRRGFGLVKIDVLKDAVELLDQLETPLLALDDESWKKELPTPTKEIIQWENAQATSLKVLQRSNQLSELVYPLSKLSDKDNLDKLWRSINSVCCLLWPASQHLIMVCRSCVLRPVGPKSTNCGVL